VIYPENNIGMRHRLHPGTTKFFGNAKRVDCRLRYPGTVDERDERGHPVSVERRRLRREPNDSRSLGLPSGFAKPLFAKPL
jgi:hypothetical protein